MNGFNGFNGHTGGRPGQRGHGPHQHGRGASGFGGFEGRSRGRGQGMPGMWEAFDQFRSSFDHRGGGRMSRGDVRAAILGLLAEEPMHGYQIINEIGERSGGAWRPSPGSVYPTLQLLSDEGVIDAEESKGRKTYSLTEAGRAEAEKAAEQGAPWEAQAAQRGPGMGALPKAGVDLAQAAAQVGRTGTPEQVEAAVEILTEARRKLYAILAAS